MEVLLNPIKPLFFDLVSRCKERMFLCSPFIKKSVAEAVLENKPSGVDASLLTAYKLSSFYRSSSDLGALRDFIDSETDVRSFHRLHAKVYLFDEEAAIVTSSNLTEAGLTANYECGVLVRDTDIVGKLASTFETLMQDSERVFSITGEILSATEDVLAKTPRVKLPSLEGKEKELLPLPATESTDDLYDGGTESIIESVAEWTRDVFEVLCKMPSAIFTAKQAYAFESELQKLHPNNRTIPDQIRKQLQIIRNLGLLEFLGGGVYRKLWRE
jgi:HKD family nuclease